MKKSLMLLLAFASVAAADEYSVTLIDVDFTQVTALPEGWSEGSSNNSVFSFTDNGAIPSVDWKKNWMKTTLSLPAHTASQISFELYNNNGDTGVENSMYLTTSSGNYSIVVGTSLYDANGEVSNDGVYVGFLPADVGGTIYYLHNYEGVAGAKVEQISDILPNVSASYTLTFADGALSVKIVDANDKEWSNTYSVPDVTFDTIGFIVNTEGGKNGVRSISVRTVPEPATATLSLLALAGLAVRRRRR